MINGDLLWIWLVLIYLLRLIVPHIYELLDLISSWMIKNSSAKRRIVVRNSFALVKRFMVFRVAAQTSGNITLIGSVTTVFNRIVLMRVYGIA